MAQQPGYLDVPSRLGFKPSAGAHPVQIAVNVELQKIAGRIAGTSRGFSRDPREARRLKVQPIDKGVDEPNRIIRAHVVVHGFRQEQQLRAIVT
jgi:hypothetical protein